MPVLLSGEESTAVILVWRVRHARVAGLADLPFGDRGMAWPVHWIACAVGQYVVQAPSLAGGNRCIATDEGIFFAYSRILTR